MAEHGPLPNVSPDVLSQPELRVAKLLAAGCSVDRIAAAMDCDCALVFAHRDAIFEKLGIQGHSTLIRWAKRYDVERW
jgi:DNA-binding NarL/FixJ family response regulator